MRRSIVALAAVLCAGAAACSSTVDGTGSFGAAGSGAPLSGKSPKDILAAAGEVSLAATSVHITGVDYVEKSKYTVDMHVGGDKTCKGVVTIGSEDPVDLTIVEGNLYYSTDKGKTYKDGSETTDASKEAIQLCSKSALQQIVTPGSSVAKKGAGTVDGKKAVTVTNSDAEVTVQDDSGSPYLLEFKTPKEDKTDLHFTDWNVPVSVEKPDVKSD